MELTENKNCSQETIKQKELWKAVAGYNGKYLVSDNGKIMREQSVGWRGRLVGGRILKPKLTNNGYQMVVLSKNGEKKYVNIHRVVATAFIRNKLCLSQVNHIDGDKTNNNWLNLEWVSPRENIRHALRNGLLPCQVGGQNSASKLLEKDVMDIRKSTATVKQLAKQYSVSEANTRLIINNKTWRHVK